MVNNIKSTLYSQIKILLHSSFGIGFNENDFSSINLSLFKYNDKGVFYIDSKHLKLININDREKYFTLLSILNYSHK